MDKLEAIRKKYHYDATWEEEKHPRDEGGKFTSGTGSSSSANKEVNHLGYTEKLNITKDYPRDLSKRIYQFGQKAGLNGSGETYEEFVKGLDEMDPAELDKKVQNLIIENQDDDEYVKMGLDVIKGLNNPTKERPGDRGPDGKRTRQAMLRGAIDGDYFIDKRAKKLQDDVKNASGDKEKLKGYKDEAEKLYGFIRKRFDDPKSHMERNIYALNYAKQALKDIKNGLGE